MAFLGSYIIDDDDKPRLGASSNGLHMIRYAGISLHGTEVQLRDLFCELGNYLDEVERRVW